MKKALAILLALVFVVALAAACGGGASDDPNRPLKVGFSQIGSESDWRVGNTVSVSTAIEGAGWELLFNDANQEQAMIRTDH